MTPGGGSLVSIFAVWRKVRERGGNQGYEFFGDAAKISYRGGSEVNLSINVSFLISVNYAPVHFIPAWTEVPRFGTSGRAILEKMRGCDGQQR